MIKMVNTNYTSVGQDGRFMVFTKTQTCGIKATNCQANITSIC